MGNQIMICGAGPKYRRAIAKALMEHSDCICGAIDKYIAKADDELEKELSEEGYADAKETVDAMNDMEEEIVEILQSQTDDLLTVLEASEEASWDDVQQKVADMLERDDIENQVAAVSADMLSVNVPRLATAYIQESDGELVVETLRSRTQNWISYWSQQLGSLMKITTHQQITDLIQDTINTGSDIASLTRKIMDGGWRSEYYQANRVAVTEVLRAHSVAREEAIQQSPAVDQKEWRHTGSHKNKPRPNHVEMDHQIVPKDKPFEMKGRDGGTYYPMYPRDPLLPASESVNCHCIHRGIVNPEVLGLSYDERKAMQQAAIDSDNGAFAKELDAQNMAASGIKPYNALENFQGKTREQQIKYIGGKAKMALYDAGLVDSEEMLKKVKKTSLKDLEKDGIFTVSEGALNHSVHGKMVNPSKRYPNGRLESGGHGYVSIEELAQKGIECHTTYTFQNGVQAGYVTDHKQRTKNGITDTMVDANGKPGVKGADIGQTWFPAGWSDEDIRAAGTYVANHPESESGAFKVGTFRGVRVGIYTDTKNASGAPTTIFPDNSKQPTDEGWEVPTDNE